MRNGTQEELDAAREDARLIPIRVKFKTNSNPLSASGLPNGEVCHRAEDGWQDDACCVAVTFPDGDIFYVDANDLEPIK